MAKKRFTVRNQDLREEVEAYQEKAGYDDLSAAAEDVIRAGLREVHSPLLNRARERTLVLGEMLATFALVFLAAGIVNTSIPYAEGLRMSLVLLVFAVAIPGAVELARVVSGTNELGAGLWEVVRR